MAIQAKDIIELMDIWAPRRLAEKWDNPGLQVGNPNAEVRRVLVSLDLTFPNIRWAAAHDVQMIVSHHPFFFHGLKCLDTETERGKMIAALLANGITAFAAHTNLDTARGGVNAALAEALGLSDCVGLVPVKEEALCKLVVYVPKSHATVVREALKEAGAGFIGAYSGCSFVTDGTGYFTAEEGTHPFLGKIGAEETAEEIRIETCAYEGNIPAIVAAMLAAHPYEEPVYDVYRLAQSAKKEMMGRVGFLPKEMSGAEAVSYIKGKLGMPVIRFGGDEKKRVRRVAVLGGAGAEFVDLAQKAGADLYLTGDVRYHEAQEAAAKGIILVDGGHFYTERVIIPKMAARLRETAVQKNWALDIVEDPVAADSFYYL